MSKKIDYIEFHSANELLFSVLNNMSDAYQKGGKKLLRGLDKSKGNRKYNNTLKINKSEYFPLALYLIACFPVNLIIRVPSKDDNPGFDANVSSESKNFHIEITTALLPHEGKAINDAFLKEENKVYLKDSINKEINRIKFSIKNKLEKSTIYEGNRPILLVEFGKMHPLTCILDEDFELIKIKIYNYIKWNKKKLSKCFSRIVLITSYFDPLFVRQLYEEKKVITPQKYKIFTFTYDLNDSPLTVLPTTYINHKATEIHEEIDFDFEVPHHRIY